MNPFSEITPQDMPSDDLRWIADECGITVAAKLLQELGKGIRLYIPHFTSDKWPTLTPRDMPTDDLKLIYERCGAEVVKKVVACMPQSRLYLPRIETTEWAKKFVRKHYTGCNATRLAAALGVSDRWIYKVVKSKEKPTSNRVINSRDGYTFVDGCRQEKLSLFDRSVAC